MSAPSELIRLRLAPEPAWVRLDAAGHPMARGSAAASLPAGSSVDLVLPAGCAALHRIELPAVGARHEAAVIRQLLEDRVLEELEHCHIVRGARQNKFLEVWVVRRDTLQRAVAAAEALGFEVQRVLPEEALLAPGEYAALTQGVLFRSREGQTGMLPDASLLAALFDEALQPAAEPLSATHAMPDLLDGLPRRSKQAAPWRPLLRPLAAVLGALAVLHLLILFLQWREQAGQEQALRAAIRQNFAAAHPGVPIVDPVLQWRQLGGGDRARSKDALDALGALAERSPGELRPTRIEAEPARLRLTLTTADAARLKSQLQGQRIESQTTDSGLEQLTLSLDEQGARP